MTSKYYVRPGASLNTRPTKTTITPPPGIIKPRTSITYTTIPSTKPVSATSRPSPDNNTQEPTKMNRAPTRGAGTVPRQTPATNRTGTQAPATRLSAPSTRMPAPSTRVPAPSTRVPPPRGPPTGGRSDLVPCKTCGRNFAPERVQAHSEICSKTARKKRKPFDATKHRVQGTELEAYARKGRPTQPPPSLIKSNWRRKHEEFISNIRAAKQAQQHVARGGKLTDLPPPPPMDTSDYVQCPHCNRRFNENAAERHIPKCATMLHNKPNKPTAGASKTTRGTTKRY